MKNLFGRLLTRQELDSDPTQLPTEVISIPGMVQSGKYVICNRCGTSSLMQSVSLQVSAFFCPACIGLGRVRSDELLYHIPQQPFPKQDTLAWQGTLTPYQAKISHQLVEAVEQKLKILVHAVTGAGKTEMIYDAINTSISSGGAVCIATPRTDVARELYSRLSRDFNLTISLLHADAAPYFRTPLVISTTHQLLRYRNAFDLLVIDEVDAFPFVNNTILHYAADHAQKNSATVIYLTATPTDKLNALVKSGQLTSATLSRRFHGYPLVIPKPIFSANDKTIYRYIKKQRKTYFPLLIFAPVITWGKAFTATLRQLFPDEQIGFVASTSQERSDIITQFREGSLSILVTTTILERGVTFPKVDVFVLHAHHRLFTTASLVQISGRVGRSLERPTGLIYFFHQGLTKQITQAISDIRHMNKLGGF